MSQKAVYDAYRITPAAQRQVEGFTRQAILQRYQAELRTEMRKLGYPDQPVKLTDSKALAAIDREARRVALSVRKTYNGFLRTRLDRMPSGLKDAERVTRLAPFFDSVRKYNQTGLGPFVMDRATAAARADFYDRNPAIETDWEAYGTFGCPRCQAAKEDRSIPLPNHPRCGCGRRAVTKMDSLPEVGQLWPFSTAAKTTVSDGWPAYAAG